MPWKPYDEPDDTVPVGGVTPMPWVHHSNDLAVWVTKGPNCPACQALSGRSYPLAYWQATIMPGWHKNCNCRLSLAKSWIRESPHDLWGTEPYWWNPTQTPLQYILDLFGRFFNYFSTLQKGDQYSGFDVLDPVFQSNTGFTTAGWTLLDYTIKLKAYGVAGIVRPKAYGYAGIVGDNKALLSINRVALFAKLPWEAATTTQTAIAWQNRTR